MWRQRDIRGRSQRTSVKERIRERVQTSVMLGRIWTFIAWPYSCGCSSSTRRRRRGRAATQAWRWWDTGWRARSHTTAPAILMTSRWAPPTTTRTSSTPAVWARSPPCSTVSSWVTRHNDYLLNRKADNDGTLPDYDAKVNIPYPDVPTSVLDLETIDDQIIELRKYFEAFHKQDSSIRDYAPYFKPHLCYMEGAWTKSDPDEIQEAFFSERHFFEAFSWDDLMQKKRYESYSGTKLNLENFAFMPSTLWEVEDDGTLVFGQWNYRILCHQLEEWPATEQAAGRGRPEDEDVIKGDVRGGTAAPQCPLPDQPERPG